LSGHATIYAIGILDSISAGILLYAGIAQLLVGDWLAGEMRTASNVKIAVGATSLFLGLFAMSLIGKWA
jgi:zinc transporter 1/2/3